MQAMKLIADAVQSGARRYRACNELGLSLRTVQRWRYADCDRRLLAKRAAPANKLSESECQALLDAANQAATPALPAPDRPQTGR